MSGDAGRIVGCVIIIAAIGFMNYILMKILGPRGTEITTFFEGWSAAAKSSYNSPAGLLSSASSIASAAALISKHELPISTGVNGIMLSILTSILTNVPLVMGSNRTFWRGAATLVGSGGIERPPGARGPDDAP